MNLISNLFKRSGKYSQNLAVKIYRRFNPKIIDNVNWVNPWEKIKDPSVPDYYLPYKDYYRAFGIEPEPLERFAGGSYVAVERYGKIYHLYDASKYSYGRMLTRIAFHMQGKHRPDYKRNKLNEADVFVILNATNIKLTGRKRFYKKIIYHTGYVGHLKEKPIREFIENKPEQLIHYSISKMLPKNLLRRNMIRNLHIYRGNEHDFKFLPHFLEPKKPENPYTNLPTMEELKEGNAKIIFESNPDSGIEELKDFERDIDPSYGMRISEQPKRTPNLSKKIHAKMARAIKRYNKRAKEYVYKTKTPIDYHSGQEPFYVKDEKFIKRHKLEYLFDDDPDKEDDYDTDDMEFKESDFRE